MFLYREVMQELSVSTLILITTVRVCGQLRQIKQV